MSKTRNENKASSIEEMLKLIDVNKKEQGRKSVWVGKDYSLYQLISDLENILNQKKDYCYET